jgi:hemerythrin-like metal-binding protein
MNLERFAHYRTGITIIDDEHFDLIKKMDVIVMLCRTNPLDTGEITLLLHELTDELIRHLAHEEQLMAGSGYKYLEGHKAEHDKIREKMKHLVDTIPSKSPRLLDYVTQDLEHIFVTHIDHFDLQIKL